MLPDESAKKEDQQVDLSELENFSFQPKWESSRPDARLYDRQPFDRRRNGGGARRSSPATDGKFSGRGGGWRSGSGERRDGRGQTGSRPFGRDGRQDRFPGGSDRKADKSGVGRRGENSENGRFGWKRGTRSDQNQRPYFSPIVSVEFYPNDSVFDAMVAAMKSSHKTYELFTTARLFLEKPERFAMVVKKNDDQADKNLYMTNDDGFIFESEGDAIAGIFERHVEKYFDVEEREVPTPTGNFPCLHRCGMTGRVLGPPNYHKYQETLLNHHERFLPRVPFDKFKAKIEKITDPQEMENWKRESSKVRVFLPKGCSSDGVEELKSVEEARRYFVEHSKDRAVTAYPSVRISGETFSKMPRNLLSKSLFVLIEREKSFPLGFSNNLRGRLRRAGFTIYKMGGKAGVSYISGIRRKFRVTGDVFADDVQSVISRIDENPKIPIASLYAQCVRDDGADAAPVGQPFAGVGAAANDFRAAGVGLDVESSDGHATADCFPPAYAITNNSGENSEKLLDGDRSSVKVDPCLGSAVNQEFFKNLQWLIREGYVAEFEDGTLVATEVMPSQSRNEKHDFPASRKDQSLPAGGKNSGRMKGAFWDGTLVATEVMPSQSRNEKHDFPASRKDQSLPAGGKNSGRMKISASDSVNVVATDSPGGKIEAPDLPNGTKDS